MYYVLSFHDLIGESSLFNRFWIVRSSRTMTIYDFVHRYYCIFQHLLKILSLANNRPVTTRTCHQLYSCQGSQRKKMLRFQEAPDKIFIGILKAGVEIVIDEITDLIDYSENPKAAKSELRTILPLAARAFSPGVAVFLLNEE